MSQAVSFEVDTYQNKRWVLECVLDDKDMALSTAKRLYDSQRFSAVRVVQETYDEASNSSRERVIFETTVADRDNRALHQKKAAQLKKEILDRSERRPLRKRPKKEEPKKGPSIWVMALWFLAILAVGTSALVYLRSL
ncbi:hypothetical protein [Kiloniella sp.]|uniref:hypothetical protein n=1 Tax=Kiloniella sp. TaxID=1938587 RepID=UPI003B025CF0